MTNRTVVRAVRALWRRLLRPGRDLPRSDREAIRDNFGLHNASDGLRCIVGLIFRSNKQHGYIEAATILGTMAICWIASALIIRRLTVGLIVARPEPSFFENCLTLSRSTSTICLWAWQAGATAWAALFIWLTAALRISDLVGLTIVYSLIALTL